MSEPLGYKSNIPTGDAAVAALFAKGKYEEGIKILTKNITSRITSLLNKRDKIVEDQINLQQGQLNEIGKCSTEALRVAEKLDTKVADLAAVPVKEVVQRPNKYKEGKIKYIGIVLPNGDIIDKEDIPSILTPKEASYYVGCPTRRMYDLINKTKELHSERTVGKRHHIIHKNDLIMYLGLDKAAERIVRVRNAEEV